MSIEAAGKYGDCVKLVLAVLAFPPPHALVHQVSKVEDGMPGFEEESG